MKSALRKRIEAIEIVNKVKDTKIIFVIYTPPSNWWECCAITVGEHKHRIDRVGSFMDKVTMLQLEVNAMQWAEDDMLVNPPSNNYLKSYGLDYVMNDGIKYGTDYSRDRIVPNDAINDHLENIHDNVIAIK